LSAENPDSFLSAGFAGLPSQSRVITHDVADAEAFGRVAGTKQGRLRGVLDGVLGRAALNLAAGGRIDFTNRAVSSSSANFYWIGD
jgi:hypothetical protein